MTTAVNKQGTITYSKCESSISDGDLLPILIHTNNALHRLHTSSSRIGFNFLKIKLRAMCISQSSNSIILEQYQLLIYCFSALKYDFNSNNYFMRSYITYFQLIPSKSEIDIICAANFYFINNENSRNFN